MTVPHSLAPAASPGATPHRGWRVLLAEDNPINQKVATLMLRAHGCEVEIAANGRLALEKWASGAFDLVLMDCQMPVMDGFEATQAIREAERGHHTPIVAVTANAMCGDRERCLRAGMDEYVSKPMTKAALGDALDRLVSSGVLQRSPVAV